MAIDLFNMPDSTYIHHQPPGEERASIRSATPVGFAQAVFKANSPRHEALRRGVDIVGGMHVSAEALEDTQ